MLYYYLVAVVTTDGFGNIEAISDRPIRSYETLNKILEKRGRPEDVVINFQLLRAEPTDMADAVCRDCGLACEAERFKKLSGRCPVCKGSNIDYGPKLSEGN